MNERYYESGEVAVLLQVDVSTVRRYADKLKDFLSTGAQEPVDNGRGPARRFAQRDVEIL